MPSFIISESNKKKVESEINNLTSAQAGIGWIPFVGWIGAAAMQGDKNRLNEYLDDIDLLQQYNESLADIGGQLNIEENNVFELTGKIEDLNREKDDAEEWLEDYRQMLAGEGDEDNLLLQQDRLNQYAISQAEDDLSAYADSSALELDSLIRQGFSEYTSQRNQSALANVMASAGGSVSGAVNSAARRQQLAIRAFVGDDMVFNLESDGASISGRSGTGRMGSFAKMMLSNKAIIRNNLSKYQSAVDAAKFAYDSFRDEAADAAESNEIFLGDYDKTLERYEENLKYAQDNVKDLQSSIEETLKDAESLLEDMNRFEESAGLDITKKQEDE